MNYPPASPAAKSNDCGQIARTLSPVREPSLEEHLDHLQRGLERLYNLRNGFGTIANRIALMPEPPTDARATPTPSDLAGRFGDSVHSLHGTIDHLEFLVNRLNSSVFGESAAAAAPGR